MELYIITVSRPDGLSNEFNHHTSELLSEARTKVISLLTNREYTIESIIKLDTLTGETQVYEMKIIDNNLDLVLKK